MVAQRSLSIKRIEGEEAKYPALDSDEVVSGELSSDIRRDRQGIWSRELLYYHRR
ncbi:MAG: hypothetical protein P8179_16075 [Candidatus Thiodiazotropha sp.]